MVTRQNNYPISAPTVQEKHIALLNAPASKIGTNQLADERKVQGMLWKLIFKPHPDNNACLVFDRVSRFAPAPTDGSFSCCLVSERLCVCEDRHECCESVPLGH